MVGGVDGEAAAGAQVFPNDRRVSHNFGTDAEFAQVAAAGQNVYVVWQDGREDGANVFFNRSTDGGATWQAKDTRIDHAPKTPLKALGPQIACEGNLVVVVWEDDRNGLMDVFFNRSDDGGVTWLSHDIRLDTDLPGSADSLEPLLALEDGAVYVAWTDTRAGKFTIHFSASPDGGELPISSRADGRFR